MKHLIFLIFLIYPLLGSAGQIDFGSNSNIQYSGYVGYQQLTSTADIAKTYNVSSPQLGLNIIYNHGNFQIFNQFRDGNSISDSLVYNFAQYTFNLFDETNFTIRGGKVQNEIGLYQNTRINPRTRQGVLMPASNYWGVFEDFFASGVGIEAILQYKDINFTYTVTDPTTNNKGKQTANAFYGPLLNDLETKFGSHHNASLSYSPKNIPLLLKSTYSHVDFGDKINKMAVACCAPEFLGDTHFYADFITYGIEYTYNSFIFSAEELVFKNQTQIWNNFSSLNKGDSVTATYMLNEHINIRTNYNQYVTHAAASFYGNQQWLGYYKDINIGINYHPDTNWMFQIEGHHINGARTVFVSGNPDQYKEWYMLNANIIYSF